MLVIGRDAVAQRGAVGGCVRSGAQHGSVGSRQPVAGGEPLAGRRNRPDGLL
jgi:hypothetical protein